MQVAFDVPRDSSSPVPRSNTCSCERCERTRVREHFVGAIEMLLASPGATPEARARRLAIAAELVRYAVRGVFPQNEMVVDHMVPVFVDRVGTRCAVADLLEHTGNHALVRHVAATDNLALAIDLAEGAAMRAWLDEWHLTAEEAARIQPCYSCPDFDPVEPCACSLPGLDAIFVGRFENDVDWGKVLVVERPYGVAAVLPGQVLTAWREHDDAYLATSAGQRALATTEGTGPATVLANVYDEGSEELVGVNCYACSPITSPPPSAPLSAFIAVAEGESCYGVFGDLEGWGPQSGSDCNLTTYAGPGVSAAGGEGQGGEGGGEFGPNLGLKPAPSTAIEPGCTVAGAGLLDPITQGLLWALVTGVAVARRRRVSHRT